MQFHTKLFLIAVAAACLALPTTASAATSWISPAPGSVNSGAVTISFDTSSAPANTLCLFERNGIFVGPAQLCATLMGAPIGGTYSWSTNLTDAVYRLRVVDNTISDPALAYILDSSFKVDAADPIVTIDHGPAQGSIQRSKTASLAYTVTEGNPGQTYCGIGSTPEALTTPCGISVGPVYLDLPDGLITLGVKHVDANGRVGTAFRSFTIDTVPPAVKISGISSDVMVKTAYPKFTIIAPDAVSLKCEWDRDLKTARTCESLGDSPTGLPHGSHFLSVKATDRAGNTTFKNLTIFVSLGKWDGKDPRLTPSGISLKKVSATVTGGKLRAKYSGELKAKKGSVDWLYACDGRVTTKFTGKIGGKAKTFTVSATLKQIGDSCTFEGSVKLPKAWKGDTVKTAVSFPGNGEFKKFARRGRLKL